MTYADEPATGAPHLFVRAVTDLVSGLGDGHRSDRARKTQSTSEDRSAHDVPGARDTLKRHSHGVRGDDNVLRE